MRARGSIRKTSDESNADETAVFTKSARNANKPKPDYATFAYAFMSCDPSTFKQAVSSDSVDLWKDAMKEEFDSLQANQTWKLVDLPPGKTPIKCKWVYKTKRDTHGKVVRHKARLVAKGYTQIEGVDYHETFSPVVRFTTIRYLMAVAAKFNLNIRQLDVVTAFLHGTLEEEIFMTQPEGFSDGSKRVCKLTKSIYGLKQSSRVWNTTLNKVLLDFGLKRSSTDQCVYYFVKGNRIFIVAVYVDDIIIFSNNNEMETKLTKVLFDEFKMKDMGEISSVLGIRVTRDRKSGTISLDQANYIVDLLSRFNMSKCNALATPMDANQKLTKKMCPSNEEEAKEPYRQLVGALQFCVQVSRPDICFAVNVLSRYNQNPGKAHWAAAKRVLRYLKGTIDKKITYTKQSTEIQGCCDADWAGDEDERKSTTGYVFTFPNGAISWCSKRQPTVAISTTEAEFMSMTAAIQESIWLKQIENEIFANSIRTIKLYCDNIGAINFAINNTYSARTKHIDIKEKFVHQKVREKFVDLIHLATNEMPADMLTKPLSSIKINLVSKLLGLD